MTQNHYARRGTLPDFHRVKNRFGLDRKSWPLGWRFVLRKWPYFVGDRVTFGVKITRVDDDVALNFEDMKIWGRLPWIDKEWVQIKYPIVSDTKGGNTATIIVRQGFDISSPGYMKIVLGRKDRIDDSYSPIPIITAPIIHRDEWRQKFFLVFMGGLIGSLITILFTKILGL